MPTFPISLSLQDMSNTSLLFTLALNALCPLYCYTLCVCSSNWPTFPQVYMDGELVGGADIMLQLHQNGDLITELEKIGHKSALLSEPHPEQS